MLLSFTTALPVAGVAAVAEVAAPVVASTTAVATAARRALVRDILLS